MKLLLHICCAPCSIMCIKKLREEDISTNLHKIVGTFWKAESSDKWGAEGEEVLVNGRMWVKVK